MIEYLRGIILQKSPADLVLDVHGVGYAMEISGATHRALPAEGAEAAVLVRLIVREESMTLYGFHQASEREMFDHLMTAKGVGPRSAMSALTALGVDKLAVAIVDRDVRTLSTIPGVGKKTAEQLSLDLEKKLAGLAREARARLGAPIGGKSPASAAASPAAGGLKPHIVEAIAALEALGCPQAVAQKAVAKAVETLGEDQPVEVLIREGLKHRR